MYKGDVLLAFADHFFHLQEHDSTSYDKRSPDYHWYKRRLISRTNEYNWTAWDALSQMNTLEAAKS